MADQRQIYKLGFVGPGDIISFRYKTKRTGQTRIHTVLVLNPRYDTKLKDGTKARHLIGIKLEGSNKIELRLTRSKIAALEELGEFAIVDKENNLYKLEINKRLIFNEKRGTKERVYKLLSENLDIKGQYRTYDWYIVKSSSVYLEPIRIFTDEH